MKQYAYAAAVGIRMRIRLDVWPWADLYLSRRESLDEELVVWDASTIMRIIRYTAQTVPIPMTHISKSIVFDGELTSNEDCSSTAR